ncbi:MAG: amino acid permease, partial [Terracidiphilus sp.]
MAAPDTSPSANHQLKRQLGLGDLVLAQILNVVGSSWVGVAAGLGRAETVTWVAAMLLFYLPMAGSVIALNRQMPLEGGLYAWARKAFGDLGGFLTAWNLGVYGLATTATILFAIPTELSYLIGPSAAWLPENHWASLAVIAFCVAAITLASLRGLDWGKWIHNIGGAAILAVFAALIFLPTLALIHHQPVRWTPFSVATPPANLRTMALFGQMLFGALCGLEYVAI